MTSGTHIRDGPERPERLETAKSTLPGPKASLPGRPSGQTAPKR